MRRCAVPACLREVIPDGARCDKHTREALTTAFEPEWVRRARERRLPPQAALPTR